MIIEIETGIKGGICVAKRTGHTEWETCGSTEQEAIGELLMKHKYLWNIKITKL